METEVNITIDDQLWGNLAHTMPDLNETADGLNISRLSNDDTLLNRSSNDMHAIIYAEKDSVQRCFSTDCGAEFSMILRKHHCRACGNVFCGNCCRNKKISSIRLNKKESIRQRLCQFCSSKLSAELQAENRSQDGNHRPVSTRVMKIVEEYNRLTLSTRKNRPMRLLSSSAARNGQTPFHQRYQGSVEIASDSDEDRLDMALLAEGGGPTAHSNRNKNEVSESTERDDERHQQPPQQEVERSVGKENARPPSIGSLFPSPEFMPVSNPARNKEAVGPISEKELTAALRKSGLVTSTTTGKTPAKGRALQQLSANTLSASPRRPLPHDSQSELSGHGKSEGQGHGKGQEKSPRGKGKANASKRRLSNGGKASRVSSGQGQQQQQQSTYTQELALPLSQQMKGEQQDAFQIAEVCTNLTWDIDCCAPLDQGQNEACDGRAADGCSSLPVPLPFSSPVIEILDTDREEEDHPEHLQRKRRAQKQAQLLAQALAQEQRRLKKSRRAKSDHKHRDRERDRDRDRESERSKVDPPADTPPFLTRYGPWLVLILGLPFFLLSLLQLIGGFLGRDGVGAGVHLHFSYTSFPVYPTATSWPPQDQQTQYSTGASSSSFRANRAQETYSDRQVRQLDGRKRAETKEKRTIEGRPHSQTQPQSQKHCMSDLPPKIVIHLSPAAPPSFPSSPTTSTAKDVPLKDDQSRDQLAVSVSQSISEPSQSPLAAADVSSRPTSLLATISDAVKGVLGDLLHLPYHTLQLIKNLLSRIFPSTRSSEKLASS